MPHLSPRTTRARARQKAREAREQAELVSSSLVAPCWAETWQLNNLRLLVDSNEDEICLVATQAEANGIRIDRLVQANARLQQTVATLQQENGRLSQLVNGHDHTRTNQGDLVKEHVGDVTAGMEARLENHSAKLKRHRLTINRLLPLHAEVRSNFAKLNSLEATVKHLSAKKLVDPPRHTAPNLSECVGTGPNQEVGEVIYDGHGTAVRIKQESTSEDEDAEHQKPPAKRRRTESPEAGRDAGGFPCETPVDCPQAARLSVTGGLSSRRGEPPVDHV